MRIKLFFLTRIPEEEILHPSRDEGVHEHAGLGSFFAGTSRKTRVPRFYCLKLGFEIGLLALSTCVCVSGIHAIYIGMLS